MSVNSKKRLAIPRKISRETEIFLSREQLQLITFLKYCSLTKNCQLTSGKISKASFLTYMNTQNS